MRLTRALIRAQREQLRADPLVRLRTSSSGDWIAVETPGTAAHRRVRDSSSRPPKLITPHRAQHRSRHRLGQPSNAVERFH